MTPALHYRIGRKRLSKYKLRRILWSWAKPVLHGGRDDALQADQGMKLLTDVTRHKESHKETRSETVSRPSKTVTCVREFHTYVQHSLGWLMR